MLYYMFIEQSTDCQDVGGQTDGAYTLTVLNSWGFVHKPVMCDMTSDGGGWTVSVVGLCTNIVGGGGS